MKDSERRPKPDLSLKQPDRENSDGLVKFGVGLLTRDEDLESMDDREKMVIIRAVMDTVPNMASSLLKSTTDVENTVKSLLEWVKDLKSDNGIQQRKLCGLIDSLALNGQLIELVRQIKYLEDKKTNKHSNGAILKLSATDTPRLRLLFEAAKDDPELTKVLLNISGSNDDECVFDHGLLRTTTSFDNREATALLLDAVEKSPFPMIPEMVNTGSLFNIFGSASWNGDVATLKKIIELAHKAETENSSLKIGEKTYTMTDLLKLVKKRFGLGEEANVVATLLIGKNLQGDEYSNLSKAIRSGNTETIDFITTLLHDNLDVLRVVGQALYSQLKRYSRKKAILKKLKINETSIDEDVADAYQLPETLDDFLKELEVATNNQMQFQDFLLLLFPGKKIFSGPTELSTRVETITDLPSQYDRECYYELARLMDLLDNASLALGRGAEWARRLTILFNDVNSAKQYIKASMRWAMDNTNNPAVWRHRTDHNGICWPKYMSTNPNDYHVKEVDAIEVVMGFDFPSGSFNAEPWSSLLIQYPESARYVGLAREIEAYLASKKLPFPKTIESLRSIVLEVDMEECDFSSDFRKNLKDRFERRDDADSRVSHQHNKLQSAVRLTATVPPPAKVFIQHLTVMGVLPHTVSTLFGEGFFSDLSISDVFIDEEGRVRRANYDRYDDQPEKGSIRWCTEDYQTIVPPSASVTELAMVVDLLSGVRAIPHDFNCSVTLDMRGMGNEALKMQFVKQLYIALVRLAPEFKINDFIYSVDESNVTVEEVVNKILSSKSIKEVFELGWKTSVPIEFDHDDAKFKIKVPKFSSDSVKSAFKDVHEFANWCLSLIEANNGSAQDIKEKTVDGVTVYKELVGGMIEKS